MVYKLFSTVKPIVSPSKVRSFPGTKTQDS